MTKHMHVRTMFYLKIVGLIWLFMLRLENLNCHELNIEHTDLMHVACQKGLPISTEEGKLHNQSINYYINCFILGKY